MITATPITETPQSPLLSPEDFSDIEGTYIDNGEEKNLSDLAKSSAYRWYRVTGIATAGSWTPEKLRGTFNEPASFFDLDFLDTRAEQELDVNDTGPDGKATGRMVAKPPLVMARWYDSENAITPAAGELKEYKGNFSFDPKLGLIRLSDATYLIDAFAELGGNPSHIPATVYIDVAFHAGRDGVLDCPSVEVQTGEKNGTGPQIIVKSDVERRVIQHYNKAALVSTEEIPSDVEPQLQYYANAAKEEYAVQSSLTRIYHGLLPIVPDGRIRQVTWSGGDGKAPQTEVSVNTEHNPYVPTTQDNRRRIAIDEMLKLPAWDRQPDDRKLLTARFV